MIQSYRLSEVFQGRILESLSLFSERGDFDAQLVANNEFLFQLQRLRGWSLEQLNAWFRYHAYDDSSGSLGNWALEEVTSSTILGPSASRVGAVIREYSSNGSALKMAECGAGTAMRLIQMQEEFPSGQFWAFEPADDMCTLARENKAAHPRSSLEVVQARVEQISADFEGFFDVVLSMNSAHFSRSLEEYFCGVRRCLRASGIAVVKEFFVSEELDERSRAFVTEYSFRLISLRQAPLLESVYTALWRNCGLKVVAWVSSAETQKSDAAAQPSWLIEYREALAAEFGLDTSVAEQALAARKMAVLVPLE